MPWNSRAEWNVDRVLAHDTFVAKTCVAATLHALAASFAHQVAERESGLPRGLHRLIR